MTSIPLRLALGGLSLAAGAVGCGPGAPHSSPAQRDSLGIAIVESTSPSWAEGSAWSVAEAPVLDLVRTGSGDMHAFVQVRDFARLANGSLMLVDGASGEIRLYGRRGQFQRSFGGRGDGPGEFRLFPMVDVLRDGRIVARDLVPGGQASTFTVDAGLTGTFVQPKGVFPIGQLVVGQHLWGVVEGPARREDPNRLGLKRSELRVGRVSDLGLFDTLAVVEGNETVGTAVGDAVPLMGRQTAVVPDGTGHLIVGTADEMEFQRIDGGSGAVVSIARIAGIDLGVSRRDVEAERRTRLGGGSSPATRELIANLPVPGRKPAYEQLIVDEEGNVWAGEYLGLARRHDSRRWHVWNEAGTWLGVVTTPARFRVMRIGIDEMLGVRLDENDVEHPQVLGLHNKGS